MMAVSGKRRSCEIENEDYNIHMNDVYENSFKKSRMMSSPQERTFHSSDHPLAQTHNQNNDIFLKYRYESRVNALNAAHDMQMENLGKQVEMLSQEREVLLHQQRDAEQENKILKRGVQIQEAKVCELQSQQGQMLGMLQQVVTHINSLEQETLLLQQEIALYRSGKKTFDEEEDFRDCSYY